MRYRVLWAPYAEEKFEAFLQTDNEPAILAAASRQIDQYLQTGPKSYGESRYDTIRIGFAFPLGVQFEVMDDVEMVIVHDVWRIDKK